MAACALCGKKVGMLDAGFYIGKKLICGSCHDMLIANVDFALAKCKSTEEIGERKQSLIEMFRQKITGNDIEMIITYINNAANIHYNVLENKAAENKESGGHSLTADSIQGVFEDKCDSHMLTTGFNFSGYDIKEYKGLVSGECVIGTGMLSDFLSGLSDLTGTKSNAYSDKMKTVKKEAVKEMIMESVYCGGNAIIGISYSHVTFAGTNMIGISVNGTSVWIEKSDD